jgi:kinetochore protein Spc7/SPC105
MTYNREIELVFDIAAFRPHQPQSTIDLWYIAESREDDVRPKTAEKEFFLQRIRDHIRSLPQNQTSVSDILRIVAAGWDKARFVSSQVSRINISFPTKVTQTSDSSVMVTSSLLLAPLETRVEVTLNLQAMTESESVAISLAPQAHVVYGEHFNVTKVGEFMASRLGDAVCEGKEAWSDILVELQQKLIARGRK